MNPMLPFSMLETLHRHLYFYNCVKEFVLNSVYYLNINLHMEYQGFVWLYLLSVNCKLFYINSDKTSLILMV